MRFDSKWKLKWMNAEEAFFQGKEFHLINQGILSASDASGKIVGFTVFEPRDFSGPFLSRFEARAQKEPFSQFRYSLYLPPFLKRRAKDLGSTFFPVSQVHYTPFVHIGFFGGVIQIREKVRVVNVDDSPVILKFLKHTLGELGYFEVIAQISDPLLAEAEIQRLQPDIITMDIQMPKKTGVDVVRDLLTKKYYPVLMISSLGLEEGSLVFEALNAGAFDYIQKPQLEDKKTFQEEVGAKALLALDSGRERKSFLPLSPRKMSPEIVFSENLLWCFGASTGGTQALTRVFTSFPRSVPPTLVVQHIPPVFSKAFAESLNKLCPFTVKEAEDGEPLQANHVYIAPGGFQMGVEDRLGHRQIAIRDVAPVNRFKPSVDYMFLEVAKLRGVHVVAGLLTGMGRDGAEGLLELKRKGHLTIAQDEASSTVYGMPRAAVELGAADRIVSLDLFAQTFLAEKNFSTKAG